MKHYYLIRFETYEACKVLLERGYIVCPYISNDVVLAKRLEDLGVHAVMPLASPIGTGRGINNQLNLSYIIKTQMCQLSLMLVLVLRKMHVMRWN